MNNEIICVGREVHEPRRRRLTFVIRITKFSLWIRINSVQIAVNRQKNFTSRPFIFLYTSTASAADAVVMAGTATRQWRNEWACDTMETINGLISLK